VTLLLSNDDVRACTDMGRMVDTIEDALREEHDGFVVMPPRVNLGRDGTFLRLMPAYMTRSGLMGYKTFHGSMAKGVRYLIVLCRESDGEILALVDAAYLTAARTGATSGVATRHLAAEGPAVVGLIGSGLEAETNLAAVAAVRPVSEVRVYSRSEQRRTAFAAWAEKELDTPVRAVDSPTEAVEGSTIVVVATNTGQNGPVAYRGAWLEPGQHVVSIGATSPFLRELDPETFDRADHVVFDVAPEQVFEESGDLLAVDDQLRSRLQTSATLPGVVAEGGIVAGDGVTTLFKSVGTAAQDLAAAKAVYDVALDRGVGRDLGQLVVAKQF
jgi:alanine dehydrogenase